MSSLAYGAPLSGDASTVDMTQSTRTSPGSSPETADRGIAHAAASNALKTYAASLPHRHDIVVRCCEVRNWHGLN
jgi:hypothetical protein